MSARKLLPLRALGPSPSACGPFFRLAATLDCLCFLCKLAPLVPCMPLLEQVTDGVFVCSPWSSPNRRSSSPRLGQWRGLSSDARRTCADIRAAEGRRGGGEGRVQTARGGRSGGRGEERERETRERKGKEEMKKNLKQCKTLSLPHARSPSLPLCKLRYVQSKCR